MPTTQELGWTSVPDFSARAEPRPPGRRTIAAIALAAALVGGATGAGVTLAVSDDGPVTPASVAPPVDGGGGEMGGVAAIAAAVLPTIVRVDVDGGLGAGGTGSGVVYRSDGYIVTNAHVVEGARDITVTLATGRQLDATLVGTAAPVDDIAVLRVDADGLTAARFGTTSSVSVGDLAVAVGSPFGLEGTVTAGVISSLHRNVDLGGTRLTDAVQTDAPINPGNSGGALVNERGEVIGINTAIISGSRSSSGVGFAIPVDLVVRDADQIISTGRATRPFLGVSVQDLPDDGGAQIVSLDPDGAAAAAGLAEGDAIVRVGDAEIGSANDLIAALYRFDVGQTIPVVFMRDGQRQTADVTLAERPR